jgi:short-subunit dehydrogenase
MNLADRRVLVTGASGGLGGSIARDLAGRGCQVVASGRNAEALDRLVDELGAAAEPVVADLAQPADVDSLLAAAGRVDVLVANAGVEVARPLQDLDGEDVDKAVRVNLIAPLQLARSLIPAMVERGNGHLVFVSSVAGLVATPGNGPVYTATKWGLRGLGLALRLELHGTGVGVSTIFPGPVREAGMFARTNVSLPRGAPTSSPEDVARAVGDAIEHDRAEVTVAGGSVRLSAMLGGVAPVLVGRMARRAGAGEVRRKMIAARVE